MLSYVIKIVQLFITISFFLSCTVQAKQQRIPIQNRGSDSMVPAIAAWSERYQHDHSLIGVAVSGGGSGTGIASLINGLADIANTSREMTKKEIEKAKAEGVDPVKHVVALDAIGIYVNPKNPIKSVSFEQLGAIYGRSGKANYWTDLGISIPNCQDQKIIILSRQSSSGTYELFRKNVIGEHYKRKFKSGILSMQSSKDVIDMVSETPCAIGYSSYAYKTKKVKSVCLSKKEGKSCINPGIKSIINRDYPLTRPLFMYTKSKAISEVADYINWVTSDVGQCVISGMHYAPIRKLRCTSINNK